MYDRSMTKDEYKLIRSIHRSVIRSINFDSLIANLRMKFKTQRFSLTTERLRKERQLAEGYEESDKYKEFETLLIKQRNE